MAISAAELKASVVNNWVMSGMDKTKVESIVDPAINDGVGMFWRERAWTFALKTDTFTLAVGDIDGYNCPNDCDGIVRLLRETTATPMDMTELPPQVFDEQFPFPNAVPQGNPSYYKVQINEGLQQIFVMPISSTADTVRRTYKIKYNQNQALLLIPADFKYAVAAACLYMSVPSITPNGVRMAAYQEYDALLKKAINLDKISYRKLSRITNTQASVISPNSWQYYLNGGGSDWSD